MIALSPLEGNDNSDEDGATDRNVIERVEKLGEEESIELSFVREGPVEDSGHAVVKQAEHKEDIVTAGEDYKEVVEGVLHVIRREDVDGEGVAKESKNSNRDLNNLHFSNIYKICCRFKLEIFKRGFKASGLFNCFLGGGATSI